MKILLYAVLLHCFSYVLSAQTILPNPINFATAFSIPAIMNGRFIFSDSSYHPQRFFLLWNNSAGSTTSLNNYYRVNGALTVEAADEVSRPAVCNSDTNYLMILHPHFAGGGLAGGHDHTNPVYGLSIQYDVCAPNRTRSVAGTSTSYQETYPDWSNNTGGAFGFLSRIGGSDSLFPDNNKRRVLTTVIPSGTSVLSHPYPNDEMIGEEKTVTAILSQQTIDRYYGREMYLSLNVRLLQTYSSSPDDTVLIIRIPYTTKPGMGALSSPTRYIVFDSTPHPTAPAYAIMNSRDFLDMGRERPMRAFTDNKIVLTRRMLQTSANNITIKAHFRLMGDEDEPPNFILNGSENHALWAVGISPSDTSTSANGRIKRMEPEIIYKGNCDAAVAWIRLETPVAHRLFRGRMDSVLQTAIQTTINRCATNDPTTAWTAYTGRYRWHRIWLIEEDAPRSYHAVGYLNHLFGERGMSETGYISAWEFREFDENGNAIDVPGSNPKYRAQQIRYYTEHYARETNIRDNWRGDTYSVITNNAAPYLWKSSADTNLSLGMFSGYFNSSGTEQYNYGGTSYTNMLNNTRYRYETRYHPSSLISIEGHINRYVTDPFMLFDSKHRWYSSIWATPKIQLFEYTQSICDTCTPGVTCPRTAKMGGTTRLNSGEELRFTQWLHRILGVKGQATWLYRSKAIGAHWNDVVGLPDDTVDVAVFEGYLGLHTHSQVENTPAPPPATINWLRNESLGSDYFQASDPTLMHLFARPRDTIAKYQGVDVNRIFFGRKTMRYEIKKHHDLVRDNENVLYNLDLDYWYAKGFRAFHTSRNSAKHAFFQRKIDLSQAQTRRITGFNMANNTYTYSLAEPTDSSFFDITMLRNRNSSDTNEFYIGILNRRLDPVFTIPVTDSLDFGSHTVNSGIRTIKRFCYLPTPEFDSLMTLTTHPLITNGTIHRYCQNGARQISLPLRNYSLVRLQEIGGTLDTVIGTDKPITFNFLPGEGRIFRIKKIEYKSDIRKGYLAHSNQRKIVGYPIYRQDSAGVWIETDSMYYHIVYHKFDSILNGNSGESSVFYARSKPMARQLNDSSTKWDIHTIPGLDTMEHEINVSMNAPIYNSENNDVRQRHCAYPSIVVRQDSAGVPTVHIVYACHQNLPEWNDELWICESVLPAQGRQSDQTSGLLNAGLVLAYGNRFDDTPTQLRNWGTPMINASVNGNFYCWSDSLQGIGFAWKPINQRFIVNGNHINYIAWGSTTNQSIPGLPTLTRCKHPSLNSYSRIALGEDNCALVWQEDRPLNGYPYTYSNSDIMYTRIRLDQSGTINAYLPPQSNWSYTFAASIVFHPSLPIIDFDEPWALQCAAHRFPVVYREVHDGRDNPTLIPDTLQRMIYDHIYYEHDQTQCNPLEYTPIFSDHSIAHSILDMYDIPDPFGRMQPYKAHSLPPLYIWSHTNNALFQPDATQGMLRYRVVSTPLPLAAAPWINPTTVEYTNVSDNALNLNFIQADASGLPNANATIWQMVHNRHTISSIYNTDIIFHSGTDGWVKELTTPGEYPHLAARPTIQTPSDWRKNRRIFESDDNDPPTISVSTERFAKRSTRNEAVPIIGYGAMDHELFVSPFTVNGNKTGWFIKSNEKSLDTLCSEWFTVGQETSLRLDILGGQMEGRALIEKRNNKRLLTFPIYRTQRGKSEKRNYRLTDGDNDEYRLILINGNRETQSLRHHVMIRPEDEPMEKAGETETIINLNPQNNEDILCSLYPNPAQDKLFITWTGGNTTVQLINATGSVLEEHPIHGDYTLCTQELSNGLFFLRFTHGVQTITKPFIIMK